MAGKETFGETADTLTMPPGRAAGARPLRLPERYEDRGLIGSGSMGEVRRVFDRVLGRDVAMKLILWPLVDRASARARFVSEANLVARLHHPGIVAIHDRGEIGEGRVWFTMPLVRGHTLDVLIGALHAARGPGEWRPAADGWTFRRLLSAFGAACGAVAYAHSRGIIHRDLKPSNIMVGAFGQVQVMDWGISGRFASAEPGVPSVRPGVSGTPAYMAPEQADGRPEEQGPWTDVYALGAILFRLLTNRPPQQGGSAQILARLRRMPPPPSVAAAIGEAHPPIDAALQALCARAMAPRPSERLRDASAFSAAINAWLDGAQRKARATRIVDEAERTYQAALNLRADARALREAAAAQLSGVPPDAPVSRKAPAWEMEDRAAELERDAELAEAGWEQAMRGALEHDPELIRAHVALADHYQAQMADAEARRDPIRAARFEVLLRAHDRGAHQQWLSNTGRVSLAIRPDGAQVEVLRYAQRRRRLVAEPLRQLRAPLVSLPLEAGSYLFRITAPGYPTVRYPVRIARGGHWQGGTLALPAAVPEGCGYVPPGPCWLGGDPNALDPLPRHRWDVAGFFMQRDPVTYREYLAFLRALVAAGRGEEALSRVPTEATRASTHPHIFPDASGELVCGRDGEGRAIDPAQPVVFVTFGDARAYARWWSEQTGRSWRLPHDLEWEKAARGVDSRAFPWGDHFDANWACSVHSRREQPGAVAVDAFPDDVGPYGIRGMAGNVRDWCRNGYARTGPGPGGVLDPAPAGDTEPWRMLRGGTWFGAPAQSRCASRFVARPTERLQVIGFRLVCPETA